MTTVKVAAELHGSILKVFINRFGQAVLTECGSAEVDQVGKWQVWARVLTQTGYLDRQLVKICDSEEFANSAAAEINYPVSLLRAV
jgi:hypothetical protein